jgi:RNA polymerase sigma factor for flagellar operon FliA
MNKTSHQLIADNQGLVRSIARRIHRSVPPHVDLDDLIAYGQTGLVEAAQGFDHARGTQFSTFAYYRIRGAIYDGLAKMSWLGRPTQKANRQQQMSGEVLKVEADENPDANSAGIKDDIGWFARTARSLGAVYLMTHRGEESGDEAASLADSSLPPPPEVLAGRELALRLHDLIAGLPTEAATLIRALYFEGLTLEEAGKRIGVSKAWACRLHARTLEQLGRSLRRAGITDTDAG